MYLILKRLYKKLWVTESICSERYRKNKITLFKYYYYLFDAVNCVLQHLTNFIKNELVNIDKKLLFSYCLSIIVVYIYFFKLKLLLLLFVDKKSINNNNFKSYYYIKELFTFEIRGNVLIWIHWMKIKIIL